VAEPNGLSPAEGVAHRASCAPQALGYLSLGEALFVQSEHIRDLAHLELLSRHSLPPVPAFLVQEGYGPEAVAVINADVRLRGWPISTGMGGRFETEWVADLKRNQWPI
jgi:hypothetical protein